ncbi:MAG: metallophosphoesterase [Flavobacteriales bacterium]|nr:metallophosphoesterase [Flavobacteriales bacterium]MCZ2444178.1 metallophosphoesterase [Flavobacteriales bacterium]
MKVQFLSDLHIEFPENRQWLSKHAIPVLGDVLVLAGDIMPLAQLDHHADFITYLSDHFSQVFWIPGNHEYYYHAIDDYVYTSEIDLRKNVKLVHNKAVQYNDVRFVFSTLWSKVPSSLASIIQERLSDFFLIKYQNKPIDTDLYNVLHDISVQFLTRELSDEFSQPSQTIVVTHHVPTLYKYPSKYLHSKINAAFAVEMKDFIHATQPDFWIFGHHHSNVKPFQIGKTRFLTNQLGYVRYREHTGFQPNLFLEIA